MDEPHQQQTFINSLPLQLPLPFSKQPDQWIQLSTPKSSINTIVIETFNINNITSFRLVGDDNGPLTLFILFKTDLITIDPNKKLLTLTTYHKSQLDFRANYDGKKYTDLSREKILQVHDTICASLGKIHDISLDP